MTTRHRQRKRDRRRRMLETLLCGFFVMVAYVALGYAVCMNALFDAPDSWTNLVAVLSFALQIVVAMICAEKSRERGKR